MSEHYDEIKGKNEVIRYVYNNLDVASGLKCLERNEIYFEYAYKRGRYIFPVYGVSGFFTLKYLDGHNYRLTWSENRTNDEEKSE